MKLTGAKIEGFLRSPDPNIRAVLVFGPDEGLVRERAQRLAKTAVEDLNDPFRVVEINGSDLKADPARLADEAASLSFGGGSRVVRVRQASDQCTPACQSFLALDTPSPALVVIDAGDLAASSKLRKLFETAKNGASMACYGDDLKSLPDVIRETLNRFQLNPDRDAMSLLVQSLGSDRSVTRGELEKLALYMGGPGPVNEADVRAAIGDTAASGVDDVIYSAASGDTAKLETAISRVLADGTNPVQLVRAAQRHFQRLHSARGQMAQGMSADQATKSLRPPIIFKLADAFRAQLGVWPEPKLTRAFDILTQAEIDCKTTGYPAEAICGRAMLSIAQAARAGQRRR
ncbi:DNA polymerase III subunit delta [Magnetovibrio blakemorei]|uniref:DNA-directed DNA polymerase n=1 Tax=Magnetovibrio blakemorei TaxID=28181 RepID=A0A1E5Q3E9_9PROT|nr:DNA polymerase III subunit delta [Magnetovibrio blakemorei]OEJ64122.1 DNA polymerase III subunit delta [Magnetovibrio blakemorei]